jgi:hypothetical protein
VLPIIVSMLARLTRPSLTFDPLIAEARERTRERRELIVRLAAAALILGTTLASAAFLHSLVFTRQFDDSLALEFHWVHPWWVDAATGALCILGVTGAADVLRNAPCGRAIAYTAAGVLFFLAGLVALADTGLWVQYIGRTNLAVVFLLLGSVSAVLAVLSLALWVRHRRPNQQPGVDAAS